MYDNLVSVRLALEKSVAGLPGEPENSVEEFFRFEETAAAILDASHECFKEHQLEKYLRNLCSLKMQELNLTPDDLQE